jgi:hypothetical protein
MNKPSIRVAHSSPGRVRLKVRHGKRDPAVLEGVAESFRRIPGIERVETNPVTGSVTLKFDPDRQRQFMHEVERAGALSLGPPKTDIDKLADVIEGEAEFLAQHSAGARAFVDFVKGLDREVKVASNNSVDLKLLLAGGVVAAMVFEIGATAATPVWVTLLLFGANHFVELRASSEARKAEVREPAERGRKDVTSDNLGLRQKARRKFDHPAEAVENPS